MPSSRAETLVFGDSHARVINDRANTKKREEFP